MLSDHHNFSTGKLQTNRCSVFARLPLLQRSVAAASSISALGLAMTAPLVTWRPNVTKKKCQVSGAGGKTLKKSASWTSCLSSIDWFMVSFDQLKNGVCIWAWWCSGWFICLWFAVLRVQDISGLAFGDAQTGDLCVLGARDSCWDT